MSTYIERMQQEQEELSERIQSLAGFINSEDYEKIAESEQRSLTLQLHSMVEYEKILVHRLNHKEEADA